MRNVYEQIDLPLASVLAAMERDGIGVDPAALSAMSKTMEGEIQTLERTIWGLGGTEFNINSPQQLAEILFDKLNLATSARRAAAHGRVQPPLDVLAELGLLHELPRKVLDYRELTKLKNTYVDALPVLIEPGTGRLHTRLSQTGAATGRLSSSDPNLQNIPVRTELGRRNSRGICRPTRMATALSRLLADRTPHPRLVLPKTPCCWKRFGNGQDIHFAHGARGVRR